MPDARDAGGRDGPIRSLRRKKRPVFGQREWLSLGGLVAVLAFLGYLAARPPEATNEPGPRQFKRMCATAFVSARRLAPAALSGSEPGLSDPVMLQDGYTPRIQCAFTDRRGELGAITALIHCRDPIDNKCVSIVAVLQGGKLRYSAE